MSGSARDAALRILHLLFAETTGPDRRRLPGGGAASGVSLTGFQREGVERLRRVLIRRDGAILADSVGLGKTYMALAIVEETLQAGGDAVVIIPASVRSMWRRALGSVDSVGTGCRLVSHTELARGLVPRGAGRDAPGERSGARPADRIVVVDEAHRFRNPRTMRYAALARLLGRRPGDGIARALLLTATPINNRAEDLLHLVRLFARDDAFRDAGVPSLRDAFGGAGSGAGPALDRVAAVVRSVVVRRTRDMVSARFHEPESSLRFPQRALPRVVRYTDAMLPRRVAELDSLDLAVYALSGAAWTGDSRPEPVGLILINLLKRLDSSPAAFETSVVRLRELTRTSLEAAMAGRILAPVRRGPGAAGSDGDPLQLTLVELVATGAPPDADIPSLIESLRRDLDRLEQLRPDAGFDPKLRSLLTLLDRLDGERAIVFTEYRDTAAYLERALVRRHRVGRVDGSGAWLGGRSAGRRSVVEAFAPRAHGRGAVPHRERVDVLIATDVLAEGVNLQDARHVVSYDLPWNPVRLLQRIGRIDRLGSPHAELVSYLFVPGTGLETMLGLMRRLRQKLGHITAIVGGEQADELLAGLTETATSGGNQGTESIPASAMERLEARECHAMETLRTLWIAERGESAHRVRGSAPAATTATVSAVPEDPTAAVAWVTLVRDAAGTTLLEVDRAGTVRTAGEAAVAAIRRGLTDVREGAHRSRTADEPVPEPPLEALRSHRAPAIAALRAPGPLPPHDPTALLARRLRRLAAAAGVALSHHTIDRIDRALNHLATPLDPAGREQARSILENERLDLDGLLDATERALVNRLEPPHNGGAVCLEAPRNLQVLAALHIRVDQDLSRG